MIGRHIHTQQFTITVERNNHESDKSYTTDHNCDDGVYHEHINVQGGIDHNECTWIIWL